MAASKTVSRLETEGSIQTLFVWTEYNGEVLSFKVSDGACTWQGGLSIEELEVLADNTKMDFNTFLEQTLKALSRKNLGDLSYVYTAKTTDAGSLELAWKKNLVSEDIKYQLGSVELAPAPEQSVNCSLFNHSIDCVEELRQTIDQLEGMCERLSGERQAALESLRKSTSVKDIESELYGKFKLILNEKKAKIRTLMDLKCHLTEQNEDLQRQVWAVKSARVRASPEEAIATPEEEEEEEETSSRKTSTDKAVPKPDSSVESLLCDAAFRAPSPPPAKRQRLKKGAGARRVKAEITRPPVPAPSRSSGRDKQPPRAAESELQMSVDANELLDML